MDDSKDCEDFPSGFEGQQFVKGTFARQLKEIDDELSRFDNMEGIDTNQEVLPPNKSCYANISEISKTHIFAHPIFLANCGFSPIKKGDKSAATVLKDITN